MKRVLLVLFSLCYFVSFSQDRGEDSLKTQNFPQMREIRNAEIPGAPILNQPKYIEGTINEIRTEKQGLIYPAFYDWDNDGKKDLLLGEFEIGQQGSYIKVYLNEGTAGEPSYSGKYFYATDVNGDTITNYQWCCIGIHPRIVDMDDDGYLDILSGQYNPGLISWWRGSKEGFHPRQFIDQEGYVEGKRFAHGKEPWNPDAWAYWNYTSANFADFNSDGLLDLFVGGTDGFRVALNIGTKSNPEFGIRKYLYHINGDILHVKKPSDEEIQATRDKDKYINMSGVGKAYMTPVDWDKDGVLDLLVTYEYCKKGHNPIEFFRGVNTDKGLRFEHAVPLFTEKNGDKSMPGCQPMIAVDDINSDGVNDIVMGMSIPTINGFEVATEIAWNYIKEIGMPMPGKDVGNGLECNGGVNGIIERIESDTTGQMRKYYLGKLNEYKYLTTRHRGYPFVFYGMENSTKAKAISIKAQPEVEKKIIKNEVIRNSEIDGPLKYKISTPKFLKFGEELEISIQCTLEEDWYLYSTHPANIAQGFIPTIVSIDFDSEKIEKIGELENPKEIQKGSCKIYKGDQIVFTQKFKLNLITQEEWMSGKYDELNFVKATLKVRFQTCNNQLCLPPENITEELNLKIKY